MRSRHNMRSRQSNNRRMPDANFLPAATSYRIKRRRVVAGRQQEAAVAKMLPRRPHSRDRVCTSEDAGNQHCGKANHSASATSVLGPSFCRVFSVAKNHPSTTYVRTSTGTSSTAKMELPSIHHPQLPRKYLHWLRGAQQAMIATGHVTLGLND